MARRLVTEMIVTMIGLAVVDAVALGRDRLIDAELAPDLVVLGAIVSARIHLRQRVEGSMKIATADRHPAITTRDILLTLLTTIFGIVITDLLLLMVIPIIEALLLRIITTMGPRLVHHGDANEEKEGGTKVLLVSVC